MARDKLHYRVDSNWERPSPSGLSLFKAACGGWYIMAACTDRPELATCGNCIRMMNRIALVTPH